MRVRDRQQELQGGEDFCKANAEQNAQTDVKDTIEPSSNEPSSKSDKLYSFGTDGSFEFESDQSENFPPNNVLFSGGSPNHKNWTPEGLPIGQISLEETLEDELTSGVLENNSLSYIKSKANKLENAIREVNRECDTLIAVCDTPDKNTAPELSVGMFQAPSSNPTGVTSKRMLVMASVALFATCGGVYAYVSPQNPIKLAVHTKIAELAKQPVTETIIKPSKNVYASLGEFTPSQQHLTVQAEKIAKPPSESTRSPIVNNELQKEEATIAAPVVNFANVKIANAPIVREIIPQARQPQASQLNASQIAASQTNATDAVGLSERFGKGEASEPVTATMQYTNTSTTISQTPETSAPSATSPKDENRLSVNAPVNPSKKRDKGTMERLVIHANAGATLNNSQVKILVARLAQGDCLSSALHGIFGEDKISPVFVRTILTDMENRC
ncbi:MAG: hypothetical protein QM488_04155 [Rhizobiaceae bacterium]